MGRLVLVEESDESTTGIIAGTLRRVGGIIFDKATGKIVKQVHDPSTKALIGYHTTHSVIPVIVTAGAVLVAVGAHEAYEAYKKFKESH